MLVECPCCHVRFKVNTGGTPPSRLTIEEIVKALHSSGSVTEAAEKLKISRGLLYKKLRYGMRVNPSQLLGARTRRKTKAV